MKSPRISVFAVFYLMLAIGCQDTGSCQKAVDDFPPALTPSGVNVIAVLDKGGPWTNTGISASGSGEYEILPGGLPSGGYRFVFYAPYPGTLKVKVDGMSVPKFDDIPQGQSPVTSGFFRITDVKVGTNPQAYTISVRPPEAKLSKTSYNVEISSVSLNPKYAVGTPEHESAPMIVKLGAQKVFTITVFKTGPGRGTVTSNPPGIQCGNDCIFDFGNSLPVQLQAQASASGSSFTGWSSSQTTCTGPGICSLASTGLALTATANFDGTSPGASPDCGPVAIPGFMFIGNPSCFSNDIAGHPDAVLACDAMGHFCCESATGQSEPRCGGGNKKQAPADCMDFGIKAAMKTDGTGRLLGCYVAD